MTPVTPSLSLLLLFAMAANAATVSTVSELNAALAAAKPGDTIVLRGGTWRDAAVVVRTQGITLRAETPGKVRFTGASSLVFAAPSVAVEGVLFEDGALPKGSVVTFRSHHGRLAESAIVNYNPRNPATAYSWVAFEGSDNAVERCLFERKNHSGPVVGNAARDARRNRVVESYFRDSSATAIFDISGDDAFFLIEANLLDHADAQGTEIVSLKSGRNRVARNTIRASLGGIAISSGNFNTIFGNGILCDARKGAYGMRIAGQDQTVSTNYIERCDFGIQLTAARQADLQFNTVVDSAGADLTLGGGGHKIADNVLVKTAGGVSIDAPAQDAAPPNLFEGNLVSGGEVRLNPVPARGMTIWKTGGVNVPSAKPLLPGQVGPTWARSAGSKANTR
jgi:hypothetical protein